MSGAELAALAETPGIAWAALGALAALALAGLIMALRGGRNRALTERVERLGEGQQRLVGGLAAITEAQAAAQARLVETLEARLEGVSRRVGEGLAGSGQATARSLGALAERLEAIDRAQGRIEKLSGDVLGLQEILSNKQTRGAFGEVQLRDIVSHALPADAASFQATLSNGKRADCLVRLGNPPGQIAIDAKFPLEPYEALRAARDDRARATAGKLLRSAVRKHIDDIAGRYIVEGETADQALMFLPSEAVYAELHAHHGEVVREGFAKRVWIVSPTTLMAVLTTVRGVMKDARLATEAGRIRRELGLLHADLTRLGDRVGRLDTHFRQAAQDLEQVRLSAEKAGVRAGRLEAVEFGEAEPAAALEGAGGSA